MEKRYTATDAYNEARGILDQFKRTQRKAARASFRRGEGLGALAYLIPIDLLFRLNSDRPPEPISVGSTVHSPMPVDGARVPSSGFRPPYLPRNMAQTPPPENVELVGMRPPRVLGSDELRVLALPLFNCCVK